MPTAKAGTETIVGYPAVAPGAKAKRRLGTLSLLFRDAALRMLPTRRAAVVFLRCLLRLRLPVFRLSLLLMLLGLRLLILLYWLHGFRLLLGHCLGFMRCGSRLVFLLLHRRLGPFLVSRWLGLGLLFV